MITNAKPHVGAGLVVKMDLQDFFPSVHYRRVEGLMNKLGYGDLSYMLARLTTYRTRLADGRTVQPGVLPQGAPTSPVIANLSSKGLDGRLTGLAKKWGAKYTRYADDLTFSFKERHPPKLELEPITELSVAVSDCVVLNEVMASSSFAQFRELELTGDQPLLRTPAPKIKALALRVPQRTIDQVCGF